jgi:hypothetical protein
MNWKLERDSLIAQTLAFVQSVAGKREDTGHPKDAFVRSPDQDVPEPPPAVQPRQVAVPKTIETTQTPRRATSPASAILQPFTPGEMAAEIRARVASFRAHQERFTRDREEYFATTLANLRAAIRDGRPPPSGD